jgi:sugar phosphate isomerase/epimerase
VHIKDGVRKGGSGKHEFTPFGEGEVDYQGQLKALKKDGYHGSLSLETHWRLRKHLSEEAVRGPRGEDFSALYEESSRICMINLQKMLHRI